MAHPAKTLKITTKLDEETKLFKFILNILNLCSPWWSGGSFGEKVLAKINIF